MRGKAFLFQGNPLTKATIKEDKVINTNQLRRVGFYALSILVWGFASTTRAAAPSISGHIESTYMYDFNEPTTGTTALRSYDATANTFYLNAVHLAITGGMSDDVTYTVEIDHGSDSTVTGSNTDIDIQEAYFTFPVGPLALTTGKFVTYEGIEVIEGPSNPTISRGYLYGLAEAFTHVGVKAHMNMGEHVNVGAGIVNGRDVDTDNNNGKTAIWRLGFDFGDPLSFGFSGSHGPDRNRTGTTADEDNTTSLDLTGTSNIIPNVALNFQVFYAQQDNAKGGTSLGKWSGAGLQPVITITDMFSIGARVEYMDDIDRNAMTMTNYTLTPTMKVNDSVTVRAEVRYDDVNPTGGSAGPFVDDKGMSKKNTTTASLGFSYAFGM